MRHISALHNAYQHNKDTQITSPNAIINIKLQLKNLQSIFVWKAGTSEGRDENGKMDVWREATR